MAIPHDWTLHDGTEYRRALSDSEFAFYPASQNGLGDMFLHLAFLAPKHLLQKERVAVAWAVIRSRHPLLMSRIHVPGNDINSAGFSFTPPKTVDDALNESRTALYFKNESKDELIDKYMNGPRVLSDGHLSYLIISTPSDADDATEGEYDLLMCAPHFTGDGTSLHQSTHELLVLLASQKSDAELAEEINVSSNWRERLPPGAETRLTVPSRGFAKAVSKVNFIQTLRKEIGGHALPRAQTAPQKTVIVERAFTQEQTKTILARCKANGVTVNHALSVLCNVAWARSNSDPDMLELPMMLYTAINLRPHLAPHPAQTYWFLALTYYTIVLPAFLPSSADVFWHRARQVKAQTRKTVSSPFLVSRALEMAGTRAGRARGGAAVPVPSLEEVTGVPATLPPAPSTALLGLSLIGNLDATYTRAAYPAFELMTVTTASRQKAGGMLLLEHTFGGRLWLHLCWDVNGFGAEGRVERFWEGLQGAVQEFLC